jgi:hypothetical protein
LKSLGRLSNPLRGLIAIDEVQQRRPDLFPIPRVLADRWRSVQARVIRPDGRRRDEDEAPAGEARR